MLRYPPDSYDIDIYPEYDLNNDTSGIDVELFFVYNKITRSSEFLTISILAGEVAGAVAALAVKKDKPPRDILLSDIQNELQRNSIYSLFYPGYENYDFLNSLLKQLFSYDGHLNK